MVVEHVVLPYLRCFLCKCSIINCRTHAKDGQVSAPSYPVVSQPPGQIVSFTPKILPMEVSSSQPSSTVRSTFMPMAFLQNFYQIQTDVFPKSSSVQPIARTYNVFRACGVSYASFLLSAAGCLIEYVHVYTLHKLPGVQPMVAVQCSFAFWPGKVV